MSKNLETEYKDLMNKELPDLWARIEAGITEKVSTSEVASESKETINIKETTEDIVQMSSTKILEKEKVRKRSYHRFSKYAGMIAACICIMLALPILISVPRLFSGGYNEETAADASPMSVGGIAEDVTYESAEEWYDEPAPVESAETTAGSSYEEEMTDSVTNDATIESESIADNGATMEPTESESSEEAVQEATPEEAVGQLESAVYAVDVLITSEGKGNEVNGYWAEVQMTAESEVQNESVLFLRFAREAELEAIGIGGMVLPIETLEVGEIYTLDLYPTEEKEDDLPIYLIIGVR